jgi:low affinity Fe/Cu permease
LTSCEGDATADIDCNLPLGAGKITVKAVSYPIAAGTTKIQTAVKTSSLIPASLAKVDVAIRATEQNGEDVICLDVHTEKQLSAEADIDCSTAACPDQCECSKVQCTDSINTCLADATCAAAQGCALACACSDQQCALNCAAASGSPLALPVATCINSNCASLGSEAGTLAVTWSDCGAKHATVTDLEPTIIQTGTTETLTGTGTVDEDVTSAHFTATVSAAGVQLTSCEGDATADIDCNLPLGAGKITVKKVAYPIAAGTTNIAVDVQTSSFIPASLAKVDVAIRATEQNGEDVICLDVHTEKQSSSVMV